MSRVKRGLQDELDEEDGASVEPVPAEARTVVARLADAWMHEGRDVQSFLQFCREAGYNVAESSLRRWKQNVREHGEALPGGEERGRPKALTEEQERLFVGWVFWKNLANEIVPFCSKFNSATNINPDESPNVKTLLYES